MSNPPADKIGFREGSEAFKEGRQRVSPYADKEGNPIKMLRNLHAAWLYGWDTQAKMAALGDTQ